MKEELFRKQSLDKIRKPEELTEYLKILNPKLWILLVSIALLLAGTIVWGIFGRIAITVETDVHVKDGDISCSIADESSSHIAEGMTVKYADTEAVIKEIISDGKNGYECRLDADKALPNGYYDGKIYIDNLRPISFILN